MALFEIGRVCVKIAGRDAGEKCVIVELHENNMVLVDGATRRRVCNMKHLEPLGETVEIKKGASHDEIAKALKKHGIEARATKPKKAAAKPTVVRKAKAAPSEPIQKAAKKPAKPKAEKKVEAKADVKTETKVADAE